MLAQHNSPTSHGAEGQSSNQSIYPEKCWSTTDEDFDTRSLNGLILANDWLRAGDVVYSAEKGAVKLNDLVNADDIIAIIAERARLYGGAAAADGYPDVTAIQKGILNGALAAWIVLCCEPDFLAANNVQRHALTDRDLDAAARAVIGGAQ
jgi:hypothetical protein